MVASYVGQKSKIVSNVWRQASKQQECASCHLGVWVGSQTEQRKEGGNRQTDRFPNDGSIVPYPGTNTHARRARAPGAGKKGMKDIHCLQSEGEGVAKNEVALYIQADYHITI